MEENIPQLPPFLKKFNMICTISKEKADGYVKAWMNGTCNFVPSSVRPETTETLQLDSFLFALEDFTNYVECVREYNKKNPEEPITGTLCRIGLKPVDSFDLPKYKPALFFEPVVGFQKDPLRPGSPKPDLGDIEHSARYDFSYPCPPTCSK